MKKALSIAMLAAAGCASPYSRARDAFDQAELAEARRRFVELEPEYCGFDASLRAEYALYRGLTELGLGHARYAEVWLGRAKWSLDHEPEMFSAEQRGRLLSAWRSMGRMPGVPGRRAPFRGRCAT